MLKVKVVKSEQEGVTWLYALLRRERKHSGMSRVVIFVRTDASALALHQRLRKSFASAVNAGSHAKEGLARFREGQRLVLVTPDGRVPSSALLPRGAIGVSWEPPSGTAAHQSRMRAAAGASTTVSHQLLVLRHGNFSPPLDPSYARALKLSMDLSRDLVPQALRELACAAPVGQKRRREDETLVLFHGTSVETAHKILAEGFKASSEGYLGPGVYVAQEDKAARFANDPRHGGTAAATLKVSITFSKAKYVDSADVRTAERTWHNQGFDACRANRTAISPKMEWCLKRPEQVEVLSVEWSDTLGGKTVGVANP